MIKITRLVALASPFVLMAVANGPYFVLAQNVFVPGDTRRKVM